MKKLPFLLILLLVIICVHSQGIPPPPPQFPLPSMMRYMLQWPPTVCMTLTPGRPCKQPIPQEFLLHGLWPSDQHGNVMAGSPKPKQYKWDADLVRPLERELEPFWRSLKENFNNMGIYKHEFKMHGVWAQTGVEEYFKTAIRINNNLFNKVNLYNHLRTSSIIASDTSSYSKKDIVDAIQKVFGPPPPPPRPHVPFNIYLSCTSINGIFYLNEVTFCTNPGGTQFISCPDQPLDPLRHCPDNARIILPLPRAQPPVQQPPRFQEEIYETYPTFLRSWVRYIFNAWN